MKKIPNFLIIGGQRCGTTSITSLISAHPDVFVARPDSEAKFFSREQRYAKGEDHYVKTYFDDTQGCAVAGEKSTEYMENNSAAARIFSFNPEMKILCSLRDPVDRALSNYWYSVREGVEKRSLNEAIGTELEKYLTNPVKITMIDSSQPFAYITRGLYYDNLLPYYDTFPRDCIHCIIFEEFAADPVTVIAGVFAFLGVRPVDIPPEQVLRLRAVSRQDDLDSDLRKKLFELFRAKNGGLPELIGRDIFKFW